MSTGEKEALDQLTITGEMAMLQQLSAIAPHNRP
jgi:hypothetical protein